ncbi:unnamed protein product [Orchesella dallaii]|uniref:Uncharacterized protein n=1 Tax=Orchesella dallaii TaxID=48710 RepID=A0ABP1PSZ7_9HEXA
MDRNTPPFSPVLNPYSPSPMDISPAGSRTQSLHMSSPELGPFTLSGAASRRGSFGLVDGLDSLSVNPKSATELEKIEDWEKRPVNTFGQDSNCYFCTAAGLTGRTTSRMAGQAQTMQTTGGSIDDTLELFRSSYDRKAQCFNFNDSASMRNYLNNRILPGNSDRFAVAYYNQAPNTGNGIVGHMVGMKAWKTPQGSLHTRKVDFQLQPKARFTLQPDNNWVPPGNQPFHLIDLNPGN